MLLDTTIEDLKNKKIKIITKERMAKEFYNSKGRKINAKKVTFHYALHEDGSSVLLSKTILKMYLDYL